MRTQEPESDYHNGTVARVPAGASRIARWWAAFVNYPKVNEALAAARQQRAAAAAAAAAVRGGRRARFTAVHDRSPLRWAPGLAGAEPA
jgi:hypothetical protein